jgi:hypothetical protein
MIRKALRPEYYPPMMVGADGEDDLFGPTHLDHCVDQLRQSLMCSSDISPLVFRWKEEDHAIREWAEIPHTCRNFELIREWALDRQLLAGLDRSVHLEDDIVIPEF